MPNPLSQHFLSTSVFVASVAEYWLIAALFIHFLHKKTAQAVAAVAGLFKVKRELQVEREELTYNSTILYILVIFAVGHQK